MRRTKKEAIRHMTIAAAAVFGLLGPAAYTYAGTAVTNNLQTVEDEETIEIDVNRTYLSGKDGWVMENGRWCYYQDGVKQTGSLYLQDGEYLLDSNGYLVTGWYRENTEAPYVYYDPQKGGAKAYGLKTINGATYYFYGYMRTNYAVVENGVFYYFGADGVLASQRSGVSDGWLSYGGNWYYVENGKLAGGLKTIGNVTYYFESGKMVTNGIRMVLDASGAIKWYAFGAGGARAIGWWADSDGTWYYVTESGTITTGWKVINGSWYYFEETGKMVTGWKTIGNTWYYFRSGGAMATGWVLINGSWYYFEGSGAMATGWKIIGNTWYYFRSGGQMATGWASVNGIWYYFEGSGVMATGWRYIGGAWYYFEGSGTMVTGWKQIGGVDYYFDASGRMQ